MSDELKDFVRLFIVDIIASIIVAVGQVYDVPLLRTAGNCIISSALILFGYRNGKRDNKTK